MSATAPQPKRRALDQETPAIVGGTDGAWFVYAGDTRQGPFVSRIDALRMRTNHNTYRRIGTRSGDWKTP